MKWNQLDLFLLILKVITITNKIAKIFVARKSNIVEHWNLENGSIIQQIQLPDLKSKLPHKYTGLYHYKKANNKGCIMTSNNFGDVYILPFDSLENRNQKPDPICSFNVGNKNEVAKINQANENEIVTGGENQCLKIWDITTQKSKWTSKNVSIIK